MAYVKSRLVLGTSFMPENNGPEKRSARYVIKVTIVGPDDSMLYQVLEAIADKSVTVDGIRIGSRDLKGRDLEVQAVVMLPTRHAMDILVSLTFKGASAAIVVLESPDPELESKHRNEIRENVGHVPTRVFYVGSELDKEKKRELLSLFHDLVNEVMATRAGE